MRSNNRKNNELRPMTIERNFIENADASVLISFWKTRVICTATIEESVPRFLKDTGKGGLLQSIPCYLRLQMNAFEEK